MAKAIVLDLDNTLFDTRSIPESLTAGLFSAMRDANQGDDAINDAVLEMAFHDAWSIPFPVIADRYRLPERLLSVWSHFHDSLTFDEPLHPYPDVVEALQKLRDRNYFLCLLTSGYQHVQSSKIKALRLEPFFDLILIDAVDHVHVGKEAILRDLLQSRKWQPEDVVVVGDSATSEIAAGGRLGIPTVQILRPGVTKTAAAGRHIHSLAELL